MAKPKLALIPAAQGSKFYSVLPSDGVGDFDFTRNSSATRIAPTGFIETSELFGSDLLSGYDFTSGWVLYSGATSTLNSFTGYNNSGIYKSILVSGKTYKMVIAGNTTSTNGASVSDFPETQNYKSVSSGAFSETFYFQANGTNLFLTNNSLGTTTFTTLSLQEQIGKSRLNYDLLNGKVVNCPHYLLEPARTNLFPQSQYFISGSGWSAANLNRTSNSLVSPDGTLNATKIEATGTGGHPLYDDLAAISNGTYTFSMFLKKGENTSLASMSDGYSTSNISFDLDAVTVSANTGSTLNPFIKEYNDGWFRVGYSLTVTVGQTQPALYLFDANGQQSFTGNGETMYVWGAQFEQGSYPTSYIPTNGTAITRAAETATGSGNAATFNSTEGVLMAEISALSNDTSSKLISLTDGSQSNGIELFYFAGNSIYINLWSGGVSQGFLNYEIDIENFNKVCYTYKLNNTALWINGYKVDTDTSATMPIGLSELAFESGIGGNDFYGKTRELQYFDSALTDAQLETLTSWTSLQEMITSQLYTNY